MIDISAIATYSHEPHLCGHKNTSMGNVSDRRAWFEDEVSHPYQPSQMPRLKAMVSALCPHCSGHEE